MNKRKKGYFSISAVSEILNIHQQTIRMYEKAGFISPKRSEGNTRLFSEEDIKQLEIIINYTTKIGVNLAGINIILRLEKKIVKLQNEVNKIFKKSQEDFSKEKILYEKNIIETKEKLKEVRDKKIISSSATQSKEKKS